MTGSFDRAAVFGVVALALAAAACGGPPKIRSGADERLPADGSAGGPAPETLSTKAISRKDWDLFATERLKPACDARGVLKADAPALESAGKIVGTWMEFVQKAKKGPNTADGKQLGRGTEPTRSVSSFGMTCSAAKNTVDVNGVSYPFDIAWVVSGEGSGRSLSGEEGAGHFAMFQAISFKDKRLVLAKVFVPAESKDDTDDTIVIANLTGYLPSEPDEPLVHATGDRRNPLLETLVFAKGTTSGFAYLVAKQERLGRERYAAVGKFSVSP